MKKQFLSLIAIAGLMVGSVSHAMEQGLGLATIKPAGIGLISLLVSEIRQEQEMAKKENRQKINTAIQDLAAKRHRELQEACQHVSKMNERAYQLHIFQKALAKVPDIKMQYMVNHCPFGIGVAKNIINLYTFDAEWQVYYIDVSQFPNPQLVDIKKQTILHHPIFMPEPDQTDTEYLKETLRERTRLLHLGHAIAATRLDSGEDPVTREKFSQICD